MPPPALSPASHVGLAGHAFLALALTRSKPIAWSVFAVIVSDLLFDAAGGNEYWLYPIRHPNSIPWLACPVGLAVLLGIGAVVARAGRVSAGHVLARQSNRSSTEAQGPR
jgi:hypothetical protein